MQRNRGKQHKGKDQGSLKKITYREGIFHAKMGTIKDKNYMDLTEAKDNKKRLKKYIEELYIKDITDPDNHNGVITHLKLDILKCKSSGPSEASL